MPNPLKPCPLCKKPAQPGHAPFCSRGCKDRDMLQWLSDGYRIPGPPVDDDMLEVDGLDSEEHGS